MCKSRLKKLRRSETIIAVCLLSITAKVIRVADSQLGNKGDIKDNRSNEIIDTSL